MNTDPLVKYKMHERVSGCVIVCSLNYKYLQLARDFFEWYLSRTASNKVLPFLIFAEEEGLPSDYRTHFPPFCSFVSVSALEVSSPATIGPKFCVYSAANYVNADSYIFIDFDTRPMIDLGYLERYLFDSAVDMLLTFEMGVKGNLKQEMLGNNGIYNSTESDMQYFSANEITLMEQINCINTGVMVLSRLAVQMLAQCLSGIAASPTRVWLDAQGTGFTGHREQALVNLAFAHMIVDRDFTVEYLSLTFNWQTMHKSLWYNDGQLRTATGEIVRIAHFNGMLNKNGPSSSLYRNLLPLMK